MHEREGFAKKISPEERLVKNFPLKKGSPKKFPPKKSLQKKKNSPEEKLAKIILLLLYYNCNL